MSDIPKPPAHLSRRSKRLWKAICEGWELDPASLEVLRRLCEASDDCDRARVLLTAENSVVTDRFGQLRPHPAVKIERDARLDVMAAARQLGLEGEFDYLRSDNRGGRRS